MTLAQMTTLLFEPRAARYVGRHRAPETTRLVSAPRTLVSVVTPAPAAPAPRTAD